MRVVVDTSIFSGDLIDDPGSTLYRNLVGDYTVKAFSKRVDTLESFRAATIIAHEQRHYVDYFLTNYGAFVANFWAQFKQLVPSVLERRNTPLVIPYRYMTNPILVKSLRASPPTEGYARNALVLAHTHSEIIARDQIGELRKHGGLTGTSQMEALAAAFEVGPTEHHLPPGQWLDVSLSVGRDVATWAREYVWPAGLFAGFEIGVHHKGVGDGAVRVADTRLWPPFLIAALMGEFQLLKQYVRGDDDLVNDILPSRRFLRIMALSVERGANRLERPQDAWELVNEVCAELFGKSVLGSLAAEVHTQQRLIEQALETSKREHQPVSANAMDLVAYSSFRTALLEQLRADPMSLIDPIRYWEQRLAGDPGLVPEFFFFCPEGFQRVPEGMVGFRDSFYSSEVNGRPVFIKPELDSKLLGLQASDELFTCLSRMVVSGHLSDRWLGPERPNTDTALRELVDVRFVPPYGGELLQRS